VEIGSDTDSATMAEPSHERARGAVDCHRGVEWWLMRQAKERNPRIKSYGLMWSAPRWFKGGLWSPDMVNCILAWLGCATQNGVPVSYIGGAGERYTYPPQPSSFTALKKAPQTAFPDVKVIATGEHTPPDYWAAAGAMQSTPAYRNAVDILGEHDVCVWQSRYEHCHVSQAALGLGKPLGNSEQASEGADSGAAPLARAMNRNYIDARVTAGLKLVAAPDARQRGTTAPGAHRAAREVPGSRRHRLSACGETGRHRDPVPGLSEQRREAVPPGGQRHVAGHGGHEGGGVESPARPVRAPGGAEQRG